MNKNQRDLHKAQKSDLKTKHKDGDLRIWWIPQIPMKSFQADVNSLLEAKLLLDTLARYDMFQYATNIKPDYSNIGGLNIFDDDEWVSWENENGDDIDSYSIVNGELVYNE